MHDAVFRAFGLCKLFVHMQSVEAKLTLVHDLRHNAFLPVCLPECLLDE